MKKILLAVIMLLPLNMFSQDDDMIDQAVSEEIQEEGTGIILQDSEEDIKNIVEDYIRKDVNLKGAFFIEEKASWKVLRLKYIVITKANIKEGADKTVVANFS